MYMGKGSSDASAKRGSGDAADASARLVVANGHEVFPPPCENVPLSGIRELVLPQSVRSVSSDALAGCASLERVVSPGHLQVDEGAFRGCARLRQIDVVGGISAGRLAFEGCASLERITLRDSPLARSEVGEAAFAGCESLLEAEVGDGIRTIGAGAFQNCSRLSTLRLPATLQAIGERAFSGCVSLGTVELPESLRTAGDACFAQIPDLLLKSARLSSGQMPAGLSGLLHENAPPELLAASVLSSATQAWQTQMYRIMSLRPALATPVISALTDHLASMTRISRKQWERATFFVARWAPHADDSSLEAFLDMCQARQNDVNTELCADRRVASRFPDRVPAPHGKDRALNIAWADWIHGPEALLLNGRMTAGGVKYKDGSGICEMDAIVRLVAGVAGTVPAEEGDTGFVARTDATSDEIASLLDPRSLSDALHLSRAWDCGEAFEIMDVWCRYAPIEDIEREESRRRWAESHPATEHFMRAALLNSEPLPGELARWLSAHADSPQAVLESELLTLGFQKDGTAVLDIGATAVEMCLEDDLSISMRVGGRKVRSLPKTPGVDEKKREEAFAWRRERKRLLSRRMSHLCASLEDAMLEMKEFDPRVWELRYLGDPVRLHVAARLVWTQDGRSFTAVPGGPCDAHGEAVALSESPILLAHPCEMPREEVLEWKRFFDSRCIRQPFRQIDDCSVRLEQIEPDRYEEMPMQVRPLQTSLMFDKLTARRAASGSLRKLDAPGLVAYYTDLCSTRRPSWFSRYGRNIRMLRIYPKLEPRKANHMLAILDRLAADTLVGENDARVARYVDSFSRAEIEALVERAGELGHTDCATSLLERMNTLFGLRDALSDLSLDSSKGT